MRSICFCLLLLYVGIYSSACKMLESDKNTYTTDRLTLVDDFADRGIASVAILPVVAEDSMDLKGKKDFREICYNLFLKKNYAPVSLTFTDRTLQDMGRFHTPLCLNNDWNTDPFKGNLSCYCDAVVFVSIERYLESGQPEQSGIIIWGKIGIFDADSMEVLYEYYTRHTLHPTDPGGGRDLFIHKALEEFAQLILGPLPAK
ncbi:MAG: hypothetical protein ABIK28_17685 [Planctomycetota bacterium]